MTPEALVARDIAPTRSRARWTRKLWRLPLAAKLALAFIGLVAFVLIVNGAVNSVLTYNQAKSAALEVQAEKARSAAERVGEFLAEIQTQLGWTAGAEWGRTKLDQQRYDFIRLLRQAPAITALTYLDGQGKEQIAVSRLEPDSIASGKDFSQDPRFQRAVADKIWYGPVEFRRGSEPYMTIALAHVGKTPGVTVADVNLKLVWDVITAIHVGDKGFAYVVDDTGRLIAHPDLSLVLRDSDFSQLPQVKQALDEQRVTEEASAAPHVGAAEIAAGLDGAAVLTAYAIAPKTHWIVFVQQPLAEAFATVYGSLLRTLALLGLGLALAVVSGVFLARRMVLPIRLLQVGAEKLGAGDLSQRLDIRTGDEIEALAGSFNRMAGSLQESYETLETKVEARTRDLDEALQQQTATADVLKVISRSAFDLDAVLDTLVTSAGKLCGADGGIIWLRKGEKLHAGATFGHSSEAAAFFKANPRGLGDKSLAPRVMRSGRTEHIPDRSRDPDFSFPGLAMPDAMLGVPMFRNGGIEGVFTLSRARASAFSTRQIELVESFADQAVIAIENARLFEEVQAKTRDLEESLTQQTATAEMLQVISRSAFDLETIFQTLVTTAVDLCKASSGTLCVRDGEVFRYRGVAGREASADFRRYLEDHPLVAPTRATIAGRAILSRQVEQIPDILADEAYAVPLAAYGNPGRALLGVPLLGKAGVEGAIVLTREAPGLYESRQVEILQTFADQAVIAIENARLLYEVHSRTRALEQSLDDLRKAQDRLVQSEKLASLGQLTAGIAHEIKNPLNFVNNFSSLSRELLDELSELVRKTSLAEDVRDEAVELITMAQGNLDKVVQHGKRADSIVKNMLLHSRQGSGERSATNINPLVEEAVNLAYHGARAEKPGFNVTIVKQLDPNAGAAELYPQEITRVLLNLINNAFYAAGKRAGSENGSGYEPTVTAATRNRGDHVEIVIRDNGTGAPPEVKEKMFNPFFTTKPAGEGTGLGLSLSHDIVAKQHGGAIEVESELGSFTEIVVRLPRSTPAATGAL